MTIFIHGPSLIPNLSPPKKGTTLCCCLCFTVLKHFYWINFPHWALTLDLDLTSFLEFKCFPLKVPILNIELSSTAFSRKHSVHLHRFFTPHCPLPFNILYPYKNETRDTWLNIALYLRELPKVKSYI